MHGENPTQKRWKKSVSQIGTVHMHYETSYLLISKEGFLSLVTEHQAIADQPSENVGARYRQTLNRSQVVSSWKHTEKLKSHDSLRAFAEIEGLIGKIYFRFSHLFFHHLGLRDFWWEMGTVKEKQASVLTTIQLVTQDQADKSETNTGHEGADRLKAQLEAYLSKGTPVITAKEAFTKALEIESAEIDVISKLGDSETPGAFRGWRFGPEIQFEESKAALRKFSKDQEFLQESHPP